MSTDLTEFLDIKKLFLKFSNNNYKYKNYHIKEINNLSIEDAIIYQLIIIISAIIKKQQTYNYDENEYQFEKQIITESTKLLKKINPSIILLEKYNLISLSYFGNILYKFPEKCRRKSIEKLKMDIFCPFLKSGLRLLQKPSFCCIIEN
jgi:hypothetical protein